MCIALPLLSTSVYFCLLLSTYVYLCPFASGYVHLCPTLPTCVCICVYVCVCVALGWGYNTVISGAGLLSSCYLDVACFAFYAIDWS